MRRASAKRRRRSGHPPTAPSAGGSRRRPRAQLKLGYVGQETPEQKDFNHRIIEEFRANKGQLSGPMAGRQVLLLTTTGARSGEPRTTVIGYRKSGDVFVVIASANAAPANPAWYVNLLANPEATIEVGPEKLHVHAR